MSHDDRDLLDAENQAKALMREAAGNAVLREAVEDWKREAARLKARVEELESALTGLFAWGARGHDHRETAPWFTASRVLRKERP